MKRPEPVSAPDIVQRDPLLGWKRAGLAATIVIVLTVPLYALKEDRARAGRAASAIVVDEFVGVDACAECHESATEAWRGSNHDNAMAVADSASVRGDFDDAEFTHIAFDDLPKLADAELAEIVDAVPREVWAVALTDALPAFRNAVLANLSEEDQESVVAELAWLEGSRDDSLMVASERNEADAGDTSDDSLPIVPAATL